MICFDSDAPSLSNRKSKLILKLIPTTWLKKHYFPAVLLRDYDENISKQIVTNNNINPPTKPYLIITHPHGIISISSLLHFILSDDAFPELDYRFVTISFNFLVPIVRDILMLLGVADARYETINGLLARNISVGIVIGGAREALDARPLTNDLILSKRIGFIQLALKHGASIIPVFTFGENDLYEPLYPNKPGSLVRSFQLYFKKIAGFFVPLTTSILPRRKPIHTVIGKPIKVNKIDNPTLNDILQLHNVYINRLQILYDDYKHLYPQRKDDLKLIDKIEERDLKKWKKRFANISDFSDNYDLDDDDDGVPSSVVSKL